jgi:hypothetical protein
MSRPNTVVKVSSAEREQLDSIARSRSFAAFVGAANLTRRRNGAEWDTWILYAPGKTFSDPPLPWVHTVVDSHERLRTGLTDFLDNVVAVAAQGDAASNGQADRFPHLIVVARCCFTALPS